MILMKGRRHTPEQIVRKLREADRRKADNLTFVSPGRGRRTCTGSSRVVHVLLVIDSDERDSGSDLRRTRSTGCELLALSLAGAIQLTLPSVAG